MAADILRLLWPGNSPDLNMIEPCWYYLKKITTAKGPPISGKEARQRWRAAWKELSQEKIQAWIERIPFHIQEIIRLEGGNEYIEGRTVFDGRTKEGKKRLADLHVEMATATAISINDEWADIEAEEKIKEEEEVEEEVEVCSNAGTKELETELERMVESPGTREIRQKTIDFRPVAELNTGLIDVPITSSIAVTPPVITAKDTVVEPVQQTKKGKKRTKIIKIRAICTGRKGWIKSKSSYCC